MPIGLVLQFLPALQVLESEFKLGDVIAEIPQLDEEVVEGAADWHVRLAGTTDETRTQHLVRVLVDDLAFELRVVRAAEGDRGFLDHEPPNIVAHSINLTVMEGLDYQGWGDLTCSV